MGLAADTFVSRLANRRPCTTRSPPTAPSAVMPFIVLVPVLLLVLAILIRRMFQPLTHLAADLDHRPERDLGSVSAVGLLTEIRPFVGVGNQSTACTGGPIGQPAARFVADAAS